MLKTDSDADILTPFGISGYKRMFVLGTGRRRRITIYSQQLRALVLSVALKKRYGREPPASVAIIGGGIGGLTLARALGQVFPRCSLHILERRSQLLHLLQGSRTRWLHPTINDWPTGHRTSAELPFFNWTGGFAHDVARTWLANWERFVARRGNVFVHLGVHVTSTPQEHRGQVHLEAPGMGLAAFDLVILAVGFGIESQFPGAEDSPSYWSVDSLEQEALRSPSTGRRRILISGVGDGGLIDFVRARLVAFDHEKTFHEFVKRAGHLIERTKKYAEKSPGLFAEQCRSKPEDKLLNGWLAKQLRTDTEVTLLGPSVLPFAQVSAPINAALVLRILELDTVGSSFVRGRLRSVETIGNRYRVRVDDRRQDEMDFDLVVIRHGADSAIRRDFPEIAELHARHVPSTAGDLPPEMIRDALAFFRRSSKKRVSRSRKDEGGARVKEVAKQATWIHISEADVTAAIRRLHPSADWANRPTLRSRSDVAISRALGDTLRTRLPPAPRTEADIRRTQVLVHLVIASGEYKAARDLFYERVRGREHRSLYEYGLYKEDLQILQQLLTRGTWTDTERAKLLNSAGFIQLARGQLEHARKLLKEAIELRQKQSQLTDLAISQTNLAEALMLMDKRDAAETLLNKAIGELGPSQLGLYRDARARRALLASGGTLDEIARENWRLPEPSPLNPYEAILANLSDVRLFAARIDRATETSKRHIAVEADRYFEVARPCVVTFDRAIVGFFRAWLKRYLQGADPRDEVAETLWEVAATRDVVWRARCELTAHLSFGFARPTIPRQLSSLQRLRESGDRKRPLQPLAI